MGGWSTSYRWAGVTRANVAGLLNHDVRDVDLANGVEVTHSNRQIVPSRTHLNESWVNDGTGTLVPCQKSQQWLDFIDKRTAQTQNSRTLKDGRVVPVALRKDAAVVVEYILMLDPEFTGPSEDMTAEQRAETRRLLMVMVDEVTEKMGAENIVGFTLHVDETNDHVQLMAVPVTADGKLSMKQVLGGPNKGVAQAKYVALHDSMRVRLQDAGYDATMARVNNGKDHIPLKQFKQFKDAEKKLAYDKNDLKHYQAKSFEVRDRVEQAQEQLNADRRQLDADLADLPKLRRTAQQEGHDEGFAMGKALAESQLTQERTNVISALATVQRLQEELEAELLRQQNVPPMIERWLDKALKNGSTPRAHLNKFMANDQALARTGLQQSKAAHNAVVKKPVVQRASAAVRNAEGRTASEQRANDAALQGREGNDDVQYGG
jgi:hypothetical protein